MNQKIDLRLGFGEKAMSVGKDVAVKIFLDTVLAKEKVKSIKFKWDEIVQKAAVSGFYVYFIEDMILVKFKGDVNMMLFASFLTEVFGKIIAEIAAKIIWNTVIDWMKKMNDSVEGKLIKKSKVEYIPIFMSNIISALAGVGWKFIRGQLNNLPVSKSTVNTVLESV